ncbi:hypothetical protein [Phaeovulum sp. W22_SRMD_FR3]|uniref:hypothetical protein n=1 Tax=Phaeovulum sp. W22_SRMD_FR3 TaxID=3240274 RepID=UPI003F9D60AA
MSIDKSRPAFPRLPGVTRAAEIRVPSVETNEARQRHPLGLTLALAGLAVGLSVWALFTPAVWVLAGFSGYLFLLSCLPPADMSESLLGRKSVSDLEMTPGTFEYRQLRQDWY